MTDNRPMLRAVIFDFDGVLADTEGLHLRAFQDVFRARGWTLSERSTSIATWGSTTRDWWRRSTATRGSARRADLAAWSPRKAASSRAISAQGDVLFPDARACIERLGASYALGIASGALRSEITGILGGRRAARRTSRHRVGRGRHGVQAGPGAVPLGRATLGVSPAACVAIEDSPPGLEAARAAGMRTIGVTTTAARHALRADRVIDRLDEMTLDLLAELG